MYSERDRRRLRDIVDNVDRIGDYMGGMDFEAFAADAKTVDAVERCLQRITEAVIHIGPDTMLTIAPELPVEAVRGLGNILRHEYDRIDLPTIYATVTDRLPGLREACIIAFGVEHGGGQAG